MNSNEANFAFGAWTGYKGWSAPAYYFFALVMMIPIAWVLTSIPYTNQAAFDNGSKYCATLTDPALTSCYAALPTPYFPLSYQIIAVVVWLVGTWFLAGLWYALTGGSREAN